MTRNVWAELPPLRRAWLRELGIEHPWLVERSALQPGVLANAPKKIDQAAAKLSGQRLIPAGTKRAAEGREQPDVAPQLVDPFAVATELHTLDPAEARKRALDAARALMRGAGRGAERSRDASTPPTSRLQGDEGDQAAVDELLSQSDARASHSADLPRQSAHLKEKESLEDEGWSAAGEYWALHFQRSVGADRQRRVHWVVLVPELTKPIRELLVNILASIGAAACGIQRRAVLAEASNASDYRLTLASTEASLVTRTIETLNLLLFADASDGRAGFGEQQSSVFSVELVSGDGSQRRQVTGRRLPSPGRLMRRADAKRQVWEAFLRQQEALLL